MNILGLVAVVVVAGIRPLQYRARLARCCCCQNLVGLWYGARKLLPLTRPLTLTLPRQTINADDADLILWCLGGCRPALQLSYC